MIINLINMADTNRTLYEIEVALAKSQYFNYLRNIVAFNVNGLSGVLPIFHECDMLVCSKSGYLTEIEIKRSWSDFLADFKKKHKHEGEGLISYFYYCVPECLYEKVKEYLYEHEVKCSGIITYNEVLYIEIRSATIKGYMGDSFEVTNKSLPSKKKLFLEQMLEIARLGAMRVVMLKEKLNKLEDKQ